MSSVSKKIKSNVSTNKKLASKSKDRKNMTKGQRIWADYGNLLILGGGFLAIVLIAAIIITIGSIKSGVTTTPPAAPAASSAAAPSEEAPTTPSYKEASKDFKVLTGLEQLEKPKAGEEIAVIETSKGTIKLRLFPEQAPTAVENFKGLISNGYYDGIIFHRVIPDFMIQGGDPDGIGTGGASLWNEQFENEVGRGLYNFRGALAMANSGPNTNGSQFFIVQSKTADESQLASLSETIANKYKEIGGAPWLDGSYSVFGQAFEGLDIVDAISAVETVSDKPVEDIKIIKATIEKYKG
ncbi:MAG: peptidylprolyl isomerase [Oscillospiraceae bacterium]|jgi:peptidyl-prolyl cis-trans isomerase B (cyclophilin B)|nr:peptidylprolyl isomerase [Oscillospiraceae bacterium]